MQNTTRVPSYCEDDSAWSASTLHENITCANYLPEAKWGIKRSCYKDHMEHPDMFFDVATQLYHNTRGLEVCNKCCRSCYEECCVLHKHCAYAPSQPQLSELEFSGAVSSSRRTLATSSFFHTCDQRYDCARKEYTELVPEIISEPLMNTTVFSTLAIMLEVRIAMAMESFDTDERLRVRHAISGKFSVPVQLVSISNILDAAPFLQMSVSIGLIRPSLCVYVPCEQVHITLIDTELPDLPGSDIVQATVCKLCKPEEEYVFSSAGTLDDPFSCSKECAAGFYQFQGLQSASCEPHSKPVCSTTQFLQQGTAISDAMCVNCSRCEGAMFAAPCLPHRDTVCESCPEPAANQYWIGSECTPACRAGFVWDTRKHECELCAQTLCSPGLQAPAHRDNCTHCVACPPHPVNAHWSVQNDRFDCMWLCDEQYELVDMSCAPKNYSTGTALAKLQPVCDPGHTAVNFQCVPCFEAAANGLVSMQDLPQPGDVDIKWQWTYGCRWQCIHAAGYWELRPENGVYWECISDKMHTVMLRGVDMSWAVALEENTSLSMEPGNTDTSLDTSGNMGSNMGSRRQAGAEGRTLYFIFGVVVSVPVFVLVCMVVIGVARLQWSTDLPDEREPLLNV
jgi:hypothetical protein